MHTVNIPRGTVNAREGAKKKKKEKSNSEAISLDENLEVLSCNVLLVPTIVAMGIKK